MWDKSMNSLFWQRRKYTENNMESAIVVNGARRCMSHQVRLTASESWKTRTCTRTQKTWAENKNEALPGGAPRSLVGILKCPLSALSYCFIRGSRRRWKYNSTAVCRYFIWVLSLLFGPCRLSEFTLAGPQKSWDTMKNTVYPFNII